MSPDVSADVSAGITGASGGPVLAAEYHELERLARVYAHSGLGLLEWMALPAATVVDPDLLASGVLAPLSLTQVEMHLGRVLLGPDSLPAAAASWAELSLGVISARLAIEEVDRGEVQRLWTDTRQVLLLAAPGDDPLDRATLGIGGGVGLLTAATGPRSLGSAAAWASRHLEASETSVATQAVAPTYGPAAAPHDVADLVRHLHVVADAADGTVEVQTLTAVDGSVRHVVYLPGTDDMNPLSHDSQVRDMTENVRLIGAQPTAYGTGVLTAMTQAGVRPGDPVLLVGHSQGGMQAVALAAHGTPYDVTDVVTLGSPTAQIAHYPAGLQVLSLEHTGDVVPALAGAAPAGGPDQITVRFDDGQDGLVENHSYGHYAAGAAMVDGSSDPTVRAGVAGLGNFLAPGQHTSSQAFQITRTR